MLINSLPIQVENGNWYLVDGAPPSNTSVRIKNPGPGEGYPGGIPSNSLPGTNFSGSATLVTHRGRDGRPGPAGTTGPSGGVGPTGPGGGTGPVGPTGPAGMNANSAFQVNGDPNAMPPSFGNIGDSAFNYSDPNNVKVHQKVSGKDWNVLYSLGAGGGGGGVGPTGPAGPTGPIGATGALGPAGAPGTPATGVGVPGSGSAASYRTTRRELDRFAIEPQYILFNTDINTFNGITKNPSDRTLFTVNQPGYYEVSAAYSVASSSGHSHLEGWAEVSRGGGAWTIVPESKGFVMTGSSISGYDTVHCAPTILRLDAGDRIRIGLTFNPGNGEIFIEGDGNFVSFKLLAGPLWEVIETAATAYMIDDSHSGKVIVTTSNTPVLITAVRGVQKSMACEVIQMGTGEVEFEGDDASSVLNRQDHLKIAGQYGVVKLTVVSNIDGNSARFILSGDTKS